MIHSKLFWWFFNLQFIICGCHSEIKESNFVKGKQFYKITKIAQMPPVVNESSGLVATAKDTTFWTHNDSGGKAEIYEVDKTGQLLSVLRFPTIKNEDWEEITRDKDGYLYIGDFGNNQNTRRELIIQKVNEKTATLLEPIRFHYADQEKFPPEDIDKNFDCEAFFAKGDSLYLFSKNRGNNLVKLYAVPKYSGNYALLPKDQIKISTMVTGAAISPDEKTFALVTYGQVLFFGVENQEINFRHPKKCYKFIYNQTEAITFLDNKHLLISNEAGELLFIDIEKP
ncbi:hypothetical protein [Arcicella rigui]|uniref:Uncharacterized protein n=1 Tax=Arcicella rigui TaxID=797020 RepID=A0ABU5QBH0_9BACT|nr:hypothetical protein [Arcicella rigui]MEA5139982.1 hypothetical protein [Arcicella rigui]